MRFTSLAVELIRARPILVAWTVVLAIAGLWFLTPVVFYASPPGDVANILATGREYTLGTLAGPPLAPWLADIAYRLSGGHLWSVYLLAQLCFIVTMGALLQFSRVLIGSQQAALVIILTVTITAFGFSGVEFGPAVLARPLWALILLHYWQAVGETRRTAWFALSIEVGLLLLTTYSALMLIVLLAAFTLATPRGRRAVSSLEPVFALIVVFVLVLPHLIWLWRGGFALAISDVSDVAAAGTNFLRMPVISGGLLLALAGTVLLLIANSSWLDRNAGEAPKILRPSVDPFARTFVYFVAIAPAVAGSLIAALAGQERAVPGAGVLLLPVGLALVIAAGDMIYLRRQRALRTIWAGIVAAPAAFVVGLAMLQPWIGGTELGTSLPSAAIGQFFGESFERRTGQPLPAVAGDPQIAALVALAAPSRPHLLFDAAPHRSPWTSPQKFFASGGIVVWRARDTAGTPPDDIKQRFPQIAPEVPRAFERVVQGRQGLLRIGWAIVRPSQSASNGAGAQP